MKALSRLSINQPVVRQRVKALLARAEGTRWDIVAARAAVLLGVVAGLGSLGAVLITLSGLVPGRYGVILAGVGGAVGAVTTTAAALKPRMTEAAGLLRNAHDQQTPLWPVLKEVAQVFKDAPGIVRQAKADAEAGSLRAEHERIQAERENAARLAQESRAALVVEIAAEVMRRTNSFKATPEGLVEDGVLASPKAVVPTVEATVSPVPIPDPATDPNTVQANNLTPAGIAEEIADLSGQDGSQTPS